jgi:hypothetical protein
MVQLPTAAQQVASLPKQLMETNLIFKLDMYPVVCFVCSKYEYSIKVLLQCMYVIYVTKLMCDYTTKYSRIV